jgi:hypothetical protein
MKTEPALFSIPIHPDKSLLFTLGKNCSPLYLSIELLSCPYTPYLNH